MRSKRPFKEKDTPKEVNAIDQSGNSKKSRNSDDNHNQKMTVIEIDPPPVHHLIGLEN